LRGARCRLFVVCYISHKPDQTPRVMRIRNLAATRTRYGNLRIYIPLCRERRVVNYKRVDRLYWNDGLSLRLEKPRRTVSAGNRERQPVAVTANAMWPMDFVSDAAFEGRRLRALTVVVALTREAMAIDVGQGIKGEQVVEAMTRISSARGARDHSRGHWSGIHLESALRGPVQGSPS
jgi:putative transposase